MEYVTTVKVFSLLMSCHCVIRKLASCCWCFLVPGFVAAFTEGSKDTSLGAALGVLESVSSFFRPLRLSWDISTVVDLPFALSLAPLSVGLLILLAGAALKSECGDDVNAEDEDDVD